MKKNRQLILFVFCSVVLMVMVAFFALNFGTIKDIIVGFSYHPTTPMSEIRESLELTGKGTRIFNATLPELKEKEEFNQICRDEESENAILGCYRNDRVYVYDITDEELSGIREVTAAHELLHAVYHRMDRDKKRELRDVILAVYEEKQDVLGEEIDIYSDDKKEEELYVRIGTEIADLPEVLEAHYGEIFKDQDKIAGYYSGYIAVFKEIEKKLSELMEKITAVDANITSKTAQYEAEVATLNTDIAEFNNCAKTANCFTSNWVFNNRRSALTARKDSLSNLYNEIDGLISDYNKLVAEYNENLLHGQALNMTINSSVVEINTPD